MQENPLNPKDPNEHLPLVGLCVLVCVCACIVRGFVFTHMHVSLHRRLCMYIVHVSVPGCVSACAVTDGPFNNLASMVACGVGGPKMWGVTLFFMTTQRATCYNWECVLFEYGVSVVSVEGEGESSISLLTFSKLFLPSRYPLLYFYKRLEKKAEWRNPKQAVVF